MLGEQCMGTYLHGIDTFVFSLVPESNGFIISIHHMQYRLSMDVAILPCIVHVNSTIILDEKSYHVHIVIYTDIDYIVIL